jgi:hypothetical protein
VRRAAASDTRADTLQRVRGIERVVQYPAPPSPARGLVLPNR